MQFKSNSADFFSRIVNWLSQFGSDRPLVNRKGGSQDPFSRLMNRISR